MRKNLSFAGILLVLLTILALSTEVAAQCPMCRMSAESNMANGGTAGNGLNGGILYMLATPYLLVGVFAFLWWRNRKKVDQATDEPS